MTSPGAERSFGWLGELLGDKKRWAVAAALQVAVLLVILWICVRPTEGANFSSIRWCVICGTWGAADIPLNVLLYVPLGFAALLRTGSIRNAVVTGLVLSVAVEVVQLWLPGRSSAPMDVVANTMGAYLGALACLHLRELLWPRAEMRQRVLGLATAIVALLTLMPVVLFTPVVPAGDLYLNRAPGAGFLMQYGGVVVEARVDSMRLTNGRLPEPDRIRALLEEQSEVVIRLRAGRPPLRPASLIQVTTGTQADVLLVGVDSTTVVARPHLLARQLTFAGPDVRVDDALNGVEIGDTVLVRLRTNPSRDFEVEVNGRVSTSGWTVARGWSLLRYRGSLGAGLRQALDGLWLLLLFAPIGLWAPSLRSLALAVVGPLSIALLAPPWSFVEPMNGLHWAALIVAILVGRGVRSLEPGGVEPAA